MQEKANNTSKILGISTLENDFVRLSFQSKNLFINALHGCGEEEEKNKWKDFHIKL